MPSTVPELPNAYLVRGGLAILKAKLFARDSLSSNMALTSSASADPPPTPQQPLQPPQQPQQQKRNKVGAHGMGGVGKTTIAAALVHDEEVRETFAKIVWVSVGQHPNIRELQEVRVRIILF